MEDKRYVTGLEVQFEMYLGDREVLLLLDPNSAEMPYLVGYCTMNGLGLEELTELVGGNDYLEATEEFLSRVQGQIEQVRTDRTRSAEPQEAFCKEYCLPGGLEQDLNGRVVVLKPEMLRPEYRNIAHQLLLVHGGFGAAPNARGTAVFATNVFSGEKRDCRRHQVAGILNPAFAPEWVKPGVEKIRAQLNEKGSKPHER
jgi:hypothetical protein